MNKTAATLILIFVALLVGCSVGFGYSLNAQIAAQQGCESQGLVAVHAVDHYVCVEIASIP